MGSLSPLLLRVLRFDVLDCRSTCGSSSSASSSESPTLVDLLLTASSTLMTLGSSALSMVLLLQVHCAIRSDVPPTMTPVALWHTSSATSSSSSTSTTTLNSTDLCCSSPLLTSLSSASSSCTLSATGRLSRLAIVSLGQQLEVGRYADRLS